MIDTILNFLKSYPELIAVLLGTIGSWVAAWVAEYFFPESWSVKRTQRVTIAINVVFGTFVAYICWRVLDPADPRPFSFTVSLVTGLASPFTYVFVSKAAAHFFPWLSFAPPKP